MDIVFLIGRYLATRRIVLVATICVSLSVCAMIVVTAVMDGFRSRIQESVRSVDPDLVVRFRSNPPARHFDAVAAELAMEMDGRGGPIRAISPCLVAKGLLVSSLQTADAPLVSWQGVVVRGIDWARERDVLALEGILDRTPGSYLFSPPDEGGDPLVDRPVPGMLAGASLAATMNLSSTMVRSLSATSRVSLHLGQPRLQADGTWDLDLANIDFDIAGGFESGRNDFDAYQVFVDRRYLHELRYGKGAKQPDCTVVHVALADRYRRDASRIKEELAVRHPILHFESWEDRNSDLMNALNVEKRTMTLVLGLLVLISVSLLFALLYMMVLEKLRDIGVLRSMGMSPAGIRALFAGYGTTLGIAGASFGTVLGVLAVMNLDGLTRILDDVFGIEIFNRDVPYRFRDIPAILEASQVVWIAVAAVLLAVVASMVSAWKASGYDPIRCIRHE